MKSIFFLALIIFPFIVVADPVTKRDWQPIIGVSPNLEYVAYYDRNSIKVNEEKNGKYTSGTILLVAKDQIIVKVDDKPVATKSMMKNYVVECESGLTLEYSDYIYNVSFPTDTSTPLGHIVRGLDEAVVMSKDSTFYHLFCPKYI